MSKAVCRGLYIMKHAGGNAEFGVAAMRLAEDRLKSACQLKYKKKYIWQKLFLM